MLKYRKKKMEVITGEIISINENLHFLQNLYKVRVKNVKFCVENFL